METERRKRLLTDEDIKAIGIIVAEHAVPCRWDFTQEEVNIMKSHIVTWKKATSIIGSVFLTALAVILFGIFTKGFWASIVEGIKK